MVIASFVVFLLVFFGIGLYSITKARQTRHDYYLAGSEVPPWLTAVSAVATQNSGYLFIGFIGLVHSVGLSAAWVMGGWIVGDFFGSLFIHRRLREVTGQTNEASFTGVLACWGHNEFKVWRRLAALVTVIFLGAYASGQVTAGSKALEGVLGWHPHVGAVVVAAMIMAYSVAGGIRASIWTDAAQAVVMLVALIVLLVTAIEFSGGPLQMITDLREIPGFLDWNPPNVLIPGVSGLALFVAGWLFAGFSVVGQPHIMVRFMAMKDASQMTRMRIWYYGYFTAIFGVGLAVGLVSRLYFEGISGIDPELTLPMMAAELLPPYLTGLILAGMFAATMSTADSLVLSCSAAITHDLLPKQLEKPWQLKLATTLVTIGAMAFAMIEVRSVFHLVILAWSAIACAFGPLITLQAIGRQITEKTAITMLIAGLFASLAWRIADLHLAIYEGFPGIVAGLIIGWLFSKPRPSRHHSVSANGV